MEEKRVRYLMAVDHSAIATLYCGSYGLPDVYWQNRGESEVYLDCSEWGPLIEGLLDGYLVEVGREVSMAFIEKWGEPDGTDDAQV